MEEDLEDIIELADSSAIEDSKEDTYDDPVAGTIVGMVQDKYKKASTARETEEQRWIRSYRNYRGIYGPDVQFTSTEKSRVFVKVTKTKVLAAYGQIADVLFGGNKFPISIDPTRLPDNVEEVVNFETNPDQVKANESMPDLLPGETYPEFRERLAGLEKTLSPVIDFSADCSES